MGIDCRKAALCQAMLLPPICSNAHERFSGVGCFGVPLVRFSTVNRSREVTKTFQLDPVAFVMVFLRRNLRAMLLPETDTVVVDAPGQLDTRASEIDIATSAVCHRIAQGCRRSGTFNCHSLGGIGHGMFASRVALAVAGLKMSTSQDSCSRKSKAQIWIRSPPFLLVFVVPNESNKLLNLYQSQIWISFGDAEMLTSVLNPLLRCSKSLGSRMLRFVVLINCYTLRADRAGGLRRVAEFVSSVLPHLGRQRPGNVETCKRISITAMADSICNLSSHKQRFYGLNGVACALLDLGFEGTTLWPSTSSSHTWRQGRSWMKLENTHRALVVCAYHINPVFSHGHTRP